MVSVALSLALASAPALAEPAITLKDGLIEGTVKPGEALKVAGTVPAAVEQVRLVAVRYTMPPAHLGAMLVDAGEASLRVEAVDDQVVLPERTISAQT